MSETESQVFTRGVWRLVPFRPLWSLALALCNAAHAYEGETERPGLVKGAAYLHGVCGLWSVGQ